MNTNRPRRQPRQPKQAATQPPDQFEEMPDPLTVVEHATIPGFIRRCPHRFHMDEITRFGDKVGRLAESLQVSYLTTIDRSLGVIRLFPMPLLERVYQVMAAQFNWERFIDVPALEGRSTSEMLRANERAKRDLQSAVVEGAPPEVTEAMTKILAWLESETTRLQGEVPPPTPPPLRAL